MISGQLMAQRAPGTVPTKPVKAVSSSSKGEVKASSSSKKGEVKAVSSSSQNKEKKAVSSSSDRTGTKTTVGKKAPVSPSKVPASGAGGVTTAKTVKGSPATPAANPDAAPTCGDGFTAVKIEGTYACIKEPKTFGNDQMHGNLEAEVDITVNNTKFPLKAAYNVNYNKEDLKLRSGYLREDVAVSLASGKYKFRSQKPISFHANSNLMHGRLAENTVVTLDGKQYKAKAMMKHEPDIVFDKQGVPTTFYLNEALSTGVISPITLPIGTKLWFRTTKDLTVYFDKAPGLNIKVEGNEYPIGHTWASELYYNRDRKLLSFIIGDEQAVEVDGVKIPIKKNSQVNLSNDGKQYFFKSFQVAEDLTVNVYNNGALSKKEVKAGRKVYMKDGRVSKVQ